VTLLLLLQSGLWLLFARIAIAEQGRSGLLRRRAVLEVTEEAEEL
jgi:hypothetical protein